jgi:hypothetical protein
LSHATSPNFLILTNILWLGKENSCSLKTHTELFVAFVDKEW